MIVRAYQQQISRNVVLSPNSPVLSRQGSLIIPDGPFGPIIGHGGGVTALSTRRDPSVTFNIAYAPSRPDARSSKHVSSETDVAVTETYHLSNSPRKPIDGLAPLAKCRILGTEVSSAFREPIPRCHPKTRRPPLERIIAWAINPSTNNPHIFWVSGPAGIGKSAIAQTVAEELKTLRYLGAAFFFSKDQSMNFEPAKIIASIACQLAYSFPEYGRIVGKALNKDPFILKKNLAMQFKELLVEPFCATMIEGGAQRPAVVVIDGLDEHPDQKVQCELVKLIGGCSRHLQDGFPLMWMISSRSEWHLESTFFHSEPRIRCLHEDLYWLGRGDIEVYMKDGLQEIAHAHQSLPGDPFGWESTWLSAEDTQALIKMAGNVFTVAVSIIDRVRTDFTNTSYPSQRIQTLLSCITNADTETPFPPTPSTTITPHPFTPVNTLYSRALSRLPPNLLPLILQIFKLWATQPTLTAFELSNLLGLERGTFHYILRHLHGLVRFSHDDKYNRQFLRNIHPSFLAFVTNPDFATRIHDHGRTKMNCSLSVTSTSSSSSVSSAIAKSLFHLLLKPRLLLATNGLTWRSTPPYGFDPTTLAIQDVRVSHEIVTWATRLAWGFCVNIRRQQTTTRTNLRWNSEMMSTGMVRHTEEFWYEFFSTKFDFGNMPSVDCGRIPVADFKQFVGWLYQLQSVRRREHQVVRTTPQYPKDEELIEKCDGIAEPLNLDAIHGNDDSDGAETVHFVLLGLFSKTSVVLLTSESVTIYSIRSINDL